MSIRRFSRVLLQPGLRREIYVIEDPDDRPVLIVATRRREHRCETRLTVFRFFAAELAPVLAALDSARDPGLARVVVCGETRLPSGVDLVIGAGPSAVHLRFRAPEGRLLGQPTVLAGDELAALERSAAHLASLPPAQLAAAHVERVGAA